MKQEVREYIRECDKATLLELKELVASRLEAMPKVTPVLMRGLDEYLEAKAEGHDPWEDTSQVLPALREVLIAPGRQFKLDKYQLRVAEGMAGKLASDEVSVYDVICDAKEEKVISFSLHCNLSLNERRKGGLVTALHVGNAKKFFSDAKKMEEEPDTRAEPKPKKKADTSKRQQELQKRISELLDL